jgi:hypothetical protein
VVLAKDGIATWQFNKRFPLLPPLPNEFLYFQKGSTI